MRIMLLDELAASKSVLIAGAGGGYDIFCGLPLYFHLEAMGVPVHLANLSFSDVCDLPIKSNIPNVYPVTSASLGSASYFPEKYLCEWLDCEGRQVTIYCFPRTGVAPLCDAYHALVKHLEVDTVLLVDGGTDSLMRGDEAGLGTPQEDIASILAAASLPLTRKFLTCIGFGVDQYHGVCHAQFLEAVSELTQMKAYLGAFTLLNDTEPVRKYRKACNYVFKAMAHHVSIVNSSILAALAGCYGDHHSTDRTAGSKLWINPLMSLYWSFELKSVANRCLYASEVMDTKSWSELDEKIYLFRERLASEGKVRHWEAMPA